ncbi:GAD-like domain-containing protein [Colwellia asteriadis]|uniref:GAD-like domain-containing protein n=1 Tax=Colwellia asteriadis TaxID=517723 RepID=A0ABN1LBI7_9GAMM
MNVLFDNFYNFKKFGPAIKSEPVSQEILTKYKDKLPDRLLEYWQTYGFCGWGDGVFWTVNPDDYSDILSRWLQGTEFEQRILNGVDTYHVIGVTAFGRLIIWGENSGQSIDISVNYGMLFPTDYTADLLEDGGDLTIDLFFSASSISEMDETDIDDKPLFKPAFERLGALANDEMYGFVPALALGGAPKLDNLKVVKKLEHLSFLADLGEKQVMADIVALSNELPQD